MPLAWRIVNFGLENKLFNPFTANPIMALHFAISGLTYF